MLTGIGRLLVKWTMTLSFTFTRMRGPGTIPLNVMDVATRPLFKSVGASIATKNVSKILGSGFTSTASGRLPWPSSAAMSGGVFWVREEARIRLNTRTTIGHRYVERRERTHVIATPPLATVQHRPTTDRSDHPVPVSELVVRNAGRILRLSLIDCQGRKRLSWS